MITTTRQRRLAVTIAGPVVAVGGLVLLGIGDMHALAAEEASRIYSSADWCGMLDCMVDAETALAAAQAREDAERAETEKSLGIGGMVAGVALFGSRWLIRQPEPASEEE